MAGAVERIVVQVTAQDKRTIAAKAKKLALPVSELMRRAAFAYVQVGLRRSRQRRQRRRMFLLSTRRQSTPLLS